MSAAKAEQLKATHETPLSRFRFTNFVMRSQRVFRILINFEAVCAAEQSLSDRFPPFVTFGQHTSQRSAWPARPIVSADSSRRSPQRALPECPLLAQSGHRPGSAPMGATGPTTSSTKRKAKNGINFRQHNSAFGNLRLASALDLRHSVDGTRAGIVQAIFNKRACLFVHIIEIKCGAARFSQQITVQKGNGDIAVSAVLAHHVLTAILFDRAAIGILRPRADGAHCDQNGHSTLEDIGSNLTVDFHQGSPQLMRRNSAMQFVPLLLKVIAPSVAGGSLPIARSLERLWIGATGGGGAPPAVAQ
jgi:hypothetical protein